jgi:hypothetical protein
MHPAPEGANPSLYSLLVFLHIVFAIIAIGYNFAYIIWIRRGTSSPQHLDFALRGVKFMDDYVANPCYIGAAITGFLMVFMGKPLASFLWVALAIYFVAMSVAYGIYTPLLGRQIRVAAEHGAESVEYQTIATRSNIIGAAMGFMVIIIVALKIFEPVFWDGMTSLRLFGS